MKTGVPTLVTFTAAAITGLLDRFVSHDIADFLGPILATISVAASDICGVDPPTPPTLTATDFLNLLPTATFNDHVTAVQKLEQWFIALYWCQVCQCDNGATPSCSAGSTPSAPVGNSTGLPSGPTGSACFTSSGSGTYTSNTTTTDDGSDDVLPHTTSVTVTPGFADPDTHAWVLPAGLVKVHVDIVYGSYASTGDPALPILAFYNSGGTVTGFHNANPGGGPTGGITGSFDFAVPASSNSWKWIISGTGTFPVSATFTGYCSSTGDTTIEQACCPPDPSLQYQLSQIWALLQELYTIIPVRVPNYAAGTAHAGLTGQGNVSLASTTIAVKVEITQLPAVYGQVDGSPQTYLDVGWVTPANNEGIEAGMRLTRSTQVLPLPEATSSLDYTLPPGETVTVTELQAG